ASYNTTRAFVAARLKPGQNFQLSSVWLYPGEVIITNGYPAPASAQAMFTPSLVLAYWMRGCIRPPRFFASRSSTPKPELAPRGGELALLLGSPKGGFGERGGYRGPAEEINVDASD